MPAFLEMMTMKKMILAVVAACALCCIPLFIPAIAGMSVFGYRLAGAPLSLEAILCALAPALLVVIAVFALRKGMRNSTKVGCGNGACTASGRCGCR
jgi:hypothetical protein